MMARGELLEVWLARPDGRDAQHLLLLPGFSRVLRHPVARARGLESVLESEPWYPALRDRQARATRARAGIPSATD
jgi:hypothetical protein